MKLLHYTSKDGTLRREYLVLVDDDQDTEDFRETMREPDCSLSSHSRVIPGTRACLPTEMRLVVNGAHL